MIEAITNWLLYGSLSFVMGYTILQAISTDRRPTIHAKTIYQISLYMIPILLIVPVVRVINVLYRQFGLTVGESIQTVLFEYNVGQSWFISSVISFILIVLTKKNMGWFHVILAGLLIAVTSWSSHAASIEGWSGFLGNYIHFLAVTVWIGVLVVVAWFSSNESIPPAFFKWFSFIAACSVSAIILSGFLLMGIIVPEYVQSWLLTYGQLLLIKHLLFLPLLAFGLHHLLLGMREEVKSSLKVKRSFKIEVVIAFIILLISAIMTEQTPPHEVIRTLQTESVTPIIQLFIGENAPIGVIHLAHSISGLLFMLVAIVAFINGCYQLFKNKSLQLSLVSYGVFVLTIYLSLMMFVQIGANEVDEKVYPTVKDAIMLNYEEAAELSILQEQLYDDELFVVYTVNDDDLVAERLLKVEGGYKRLPVAMLTIGGTSVREEDQKIRTFRVQSGNWHDDDFTYTYVTFGMIQEPPNVARVQIHYEGGSYIAELEQEVFLNVTSTNEDWDDQHPIDFLTDDGTVIETYARNVMEEGVYCH
ncbi:copper resistance D family protein [Bacillus sp. JCM 19034]|uniref:copper resistance D family protein n=1 Tax=Bacillus sp. JCM 19034 TaxID=1481928 RepID=UPI0007859178|nr:copper resistance D family protein [Bacillus sp. JCM 19034]